MRDQQRKRLCNSALDKVPDDFRKRVTPHSEVLHEFLDTLNAIDSTTRVNGNQACNSQRPFCAARTVESCSKPSDWQAEWPCDELVVNRACINHNQGVCPWGHDQEKAAEVRGNPERLEIANSRIRAKDLTQKVEQTSSTADSTHGGQRNSTCATNRPKGGRGSGKKAAAAIAPGALPDAALKQYWRLSHPDIGRQRAGGTGGSRTGVGEARRVHPVPNSRQ